MIFKLHRIDLKMNIFKTISIYFLTNFIILGSVAQNNINISGHWNGTSEVPFGESLLINYYFNQEGVIITGHSDTHSTNGKDSSDFKLSGHINNTTIHLKGSEFIYKKGAACLSIIDLEYSNNEGIERLTGKWRGNWEVTTCPPGVSGKINLTRVAPQPIPKVYEIEKEDYEGNLLTEELKKRNYYALIIGVNNYSDSDIQDLEFPISDAKALEKALFTHYTFKPELTIFLSNPSRTEIIESFDKLSTLITEKDHLLIFYAGHGIWDHQLNQGFWLPSDANKNSKAHWLSNSTIRDYIGGIHSKHTLLITDACFSGSIFKERGITYESSKAMLEMSKLTSRKAMSSGTLKTVPDQSVFIKYLIKSLNENQQPLFSAEELFSSFKIAVINNSPNGQVPQYGPIGQVGDEGGDFIFLKK